MSQLYQRQLIKSNYFTGKFLSQTNLFINFLSSNNYKHKYSILTMFIIRVIMTLNLGELLSLMNEINDEINPL